MAKAKAADLIVRQEQPFNAGPAPERMGAGMITATEQFFVRNHGDIPSVDPMRFRLTVDGLVKSTLRLSLAEIRTLPVHEVTATLQCAGMRRQELLTVAPIPNEIIWDLEAVSTAVWRGARLRDVLEAAGHRSDAAHVAATGLDQVERGRQDTSFGGSIPMDKALDPDTLLAYDMNGAPLPPAHGFPLRLVVPGFIGARSVKWLSHIRVQSEPSHNYFQRVAYQLLPADAGHEGTPSAIMLGELPINSVIACPEPDAVVSAGTLLMRGYALGGSRKVVRVDASTDGGHSWQVASLLEDHGRWAWRGWEAPVALLPGRHELVVRAWDDAASTQPERLETVWNPKGYMNNAWHRVRIRAV